ncbi:hypothetical protein A3Q56_05899 [Intoshia linei]|uniref:Uncharacterized protein n=1 Tax=Intoshia linei TaxID=1819745 RepID=A0A177AWA9_9BILA|nr:hypothetical protein A3Q56_05899 [Intoshia linei]
MNQHSFILMDILNNIQDDEALIETLHFFYPKYALEALDIVDRSIITMYTSSSGRFFYKCEHQLACKISKILRLLENDEKRNITLEDDEFNDLLMTII